MSPKTRYGMIALFLVGIAASWLIPMLVLHLHDTHAFSVYREFAQRGMIDRQAVVEWRKRPGEEDYSIDKRMQQIGGMHFYLPLLSKILTGVFLLNILCVFLAGRTLPGETSKDEA